MFFKKPEIELDSPAICLNAIFHLISLKVITGIVVFFRSKNNEVKYD